MQALILGGGRGMRLRPLTDEMATALLYLPGGTLLDHLLHHLSRLPIERCAIMLQYRGDQIAAAIGERDDLTPIPQNAPFTLLSALASGAPWVEEPTLVIHANNYFSVAIDYFLEEAGGEPAFLVPTESHRRGQVSGSPAYLLPPEAFEIAASHTRSDSVERLHHLLTRASGIATPRLIPLRGWHRSIESADDLLAVNRFLLRSWHDTLYPPQAGVGYDAMNLNWIAPDAEVDVEAPGLFVTVGPGARITRSRLFNTLIFPGVTLNGGREENAILVQSSNGLMRLYGNPNGRQT